MIPSPSGGPNPHTPSSPAQMTACIFRLRRAHHACPFVLRSHRARFDAEVPRGPLRSRGLIGGRGVGRRVFMAIALAALLPCADAVAQTTCFGKGAVLTCLDQNGGAAYQVSCFGSKQYRSCASATGQKLTLSDTPASANSSSTTGAIQPTGTSAVTVGGSRPTPDPAFGISKTTTGDPAFGRPTGSGSDPAPPIPASR